MDDPSRSTRAVPMYCRRPSGHTRHVTTLAATIRRAHRQAPSRTITAITVAGHRVQANALRLLLSTTPDVDVISAESDVASAREAIVRARPDVVVLQCADDDLRRFRAVLDLQLAMPKMGVVLILTNHTGTTAGRPPVDRAVLVLPAQFSLGDLLSSVTSVAARAWLNWDLTETRVPVAI